MLTPALIAALEGDSDVEVRLYAARALVVQGDARAIEPLVGALKNSDPAVREEAARSLGELAELLNSPRAVEPLAQTLTDSDWGTRQSAAEMLIRLQMDHVEQAQGLLLADLRNEDDEIQLGAAWSLVELDDDRALEPLVTLLAHPDRKSVATHWHKTIRDIMSARRIV